MTRSKNLTLITCPCGATRLVRPDKIAKGEGKYCSHKCASKHRSQKITKSCPICGKTFTKSLSLAGKYCSKRCGKRGADIAAGRIPRNEDRRICPVCKHEYTASSKRRKYCSRDCSVLAHRNPEKLNRKQPYYGPNWKAQRKAARERDQHTCQDCGKQYRPGEGWGIPVHHIRPFRLFGLARYKEANDLTNLKCLCSKCHRQADAALQAVTTP